MHGINPITKTKAYQYALAVRDGKILAGKYIILACKEFIEDINKSIYDEDFRWEFKLEILEISSNKP